MKKFIAVEGLRGWLAWTVVLDHLAGVSDLYLKGLGPAVMRAGDVAVLIFIIISGFVITHLVIERPEPYRTYLLRRFMRIFPLFAVTCLAGYFATEMYAGRFPRVSRVTDHGLAAYVQSIHEFFWAHLIAHLTMLHGAISDSFLPCSSGAFNGPAWSISLEWQFYLIAPFAIVLAQRRYLIVWFALAVGVLECAYQLQFFGSFVAPSFLPAAAGYFALGIASGLIHSDDSQTARSSSSSRYESRNCRQGHTCGSPSA